MTKDVRLAIFDVAVLILFIALTLASRWWWVLCALGSGYIAYRQLRLALPTADGRGTTRR
jgi:hypothetical protein